MDLITYDAQISHRKSDKNPKISFSTKGLISINASACMVLGLEEGSQVKFHQDKKKKADWYIEKVKTGGLITRQYKGNKSTCLMINCSMVCKELASSLNKNSLLKITMATSPTEEKYFALITAPLR